MSELNKQQLVFVCSHILKLNKAKCVHSLPEKRGLRPKLVPGRGCPSLKLRLSSNRVTRMANEWTNITADICGRFPHELFHNFRASKSEDRLFLCIYFRKVVRQVLKLQNCERARRVRRSHG